MFSTRRKIKEKYGDNEKFSDKRNKLDVEKGDIPAMMIAAFVTLVIPVILILCVIFAIVWLIFLR
ncbi:MULTISPECIES: hypothetical protein [Bacillota]|uniref:Uncharacterized protein n=1 Tax=Amedibacillus hominis TaxID=2897776 RepID=A0ABS9R7W9_9FIRM|nr:MULTISPECIES: hypothetical protein [Bacillota]MCH4284991.1 hypothetical protein [Amedibacillus hominis]RGB55212.1 hypothetical protein DW271_09595 [Absiella sp. AM22-9]RGB62841.1 hypothetical protein DW120_02995 [Absiella sp. AM10-20]RGB63142.1 hypothetical protein DW113_18125 [Absiella sp. AM09-45]RGB72268.1 hypothetical protein DW114_18505 [Absiella sp. AM09-50]